MAGRRLARLTATAKVLTVLLVLAGCQSLTPESLTTTPRSFELYRLEAVELLQQRRALQGQDNLTEIAWNAPREWRPAGQPRQGVLLAHGLGDSPWSFHDVGEQLAAQGFLVRTLLLAGHGTQPQDMLTVRLDEWRRIVSEQTRAMRAEVDRVYLGGFSTGANLALDQASGNDDVAGLLLFSPAFKSSTPYDWLTPWIGWARPWLREPDGSRPAQNAVRYLNMPTNGFAQFYRSSQRAREALQHQPYDKPTLMVVAQHDSVLDTAYLAQAFSTRFTHPASRLIWYGTAPEPAQHDARVLVRPDRLPQWNISQFSHMGLLFSPDNPLYGRQGSLRICHNGQTDAARAACEDGAPVWYSDWGYQEEDKIHARLTFNPYFAWQGAVMAQVLQE